MKNRAIVFLKYIKKMDALFMCAISHLSSFMMPVHIYILFTVILIVVL